MTKLSKKLEKLIRSSPEILPVKTEEGILVGDVLIQSEGPIKNISKNGQLIYKELHLNSVTIKIANLLAKRKYPEKCDQLYRADQEYGKWFVDSQLLRNQYQRAVEIHDYERADMLWARYIESRDRTSAAKNLAESLTKF
jgi:hypothetical protein